MNSCPTIIRICRHFLLDGRRCQQPAVRRRACCRHHLNAQSRLHNMARAGRRILMLRFRVAETLRDLSWNETEMNRVLATERLDPDTLRIMLWAMDLSSIALRADSACRPRRAQNCSPNLNGIYDVPLTSLFCESLSENLAQLIQNTGAGGGGINLQLARPAASPAAREKFESLAKEVIRAR